MENELVLFTDGSIQLEVPVSSDGGTVWLSANRRCSFWDHYSMRQDSSGPTGCRCTVADSGSYAVFWANKKNTVIWTGQINKNWLF